MAAIEVAPPVGLHQMQQLVPRVGLPVAKALAPLVHVPDEQPLARQPLIGTDREDLRRGVRDFSVGNYVIYYRPISSAGVTVEVVRVLHCGRDAARLF